MTQLAQLRQRIAALRQRRQFVRLGTAAAAVVTAVLLALLALFGLDVAFELSAFQRAAMMAVAIGAFVWSCRAFALPFLGKRESEIDVALRVEREQGIDTDLVAALQFEQPEASTWGSRDLEAAVVTTIAKRTPQLDVFRGLNYSQLLRRAKLAVGILLAVIVVSALYPRHVAVFFRRLMFSSRHYPSNTIIENLYVNRSHVLEWNAATLRPTDVKSAQGQPVVFLLHGTGKLPAQGLIECRSSSSHESKKTLELRRLDADQRREMWQSITAKQKATGGVAGESADSSLAQLEKLLSAASTDEKGSAVYAVELPRLVEDFEYSVKMGDAWTDPSTVRMIALPAVEVKLEIEPPSYARHVVDKPSSPRHIAVLEGSRVRLAVHSVNQKRLQSARIRWTVGGQTTQQALVKDDTDGLIWSAPAKGTALDPVTQEVRYEVQVTDEDGLGLETPLHGFIQLKPDRPPSVLAEFIHRVVLPTAKPIVEYRLSDDYGIQNLVLLAQIERAAEREPDPGLEKDNSEKLAAKPLPASRVEIPLDPRPLMGQNLPYRGKFPLDLAPFRLNKGDQLKLSLEVHDYRGETAGKSFMSEPLLVEISDEAGVLSAITEADERSEKRLNDVIQQQLGVGGTP